MGDIKSFNLQQIRDKTGIDTFVETGTLHGDGVQAALDAGFRQIHSIEIMPDLAAKARYRFGFAEQVQIHEGDSATVLSYLVTKIDRNAVFWLDAHFPGADSGDKPYDAEQDPAKRTPLETELRYIAGYRPHFRDVLIIDDLWLYEDGPFEWGSFNEHNHRHGRTLTREQLGTVGATFFQELFGSSHNFKRFYHHQGYLVLTPK